MMRRPRLRRYPGPGLQESVLDVQVGAGVDDGFSYSGGAFDRTSANAVLGKFDPQILNMFARFANVTIPGGATITAADIRFIGDDVDSDGANVATNIYASDEDNAAAPTTHAEHAADPRTTAFTAWDAIDYPVDTEQTSPDIAGVIQEIIDRGGWSSGQALMILWDDDGSGTNKYIIPDTYELSSARALKLHVEYLA